MRQFGLVIVALTAGTLIWGCSSLRIETKPTDVESLRLVCGPPSVIEYRVNGKLRFERVSTVELPAILKPLCAP